MSAFLVSENHIRYLVAAIKDHRIGEYVEVPNPYDQPGESTTTRAQYVDDTTLGQMLWQENTNSVNRRYAEGDECPRFTMKRTGTMPSTSNAAQLFKAISCYEYQSCEHEGWKESPAAKLMEYLRSHAERLIPGYDKAEWDIA